MSSPRCAVIGGTGLLGKCLTRKLVQAGWTVRSIARSGNPVGPAQLWWSDVEWISAALGSDACAQALVGAEVVFHLASTTVPSTSNLAYDLESNVLPTLRTLEAMASVEIPRMVFASSGGTVYGAAESIPIPETHPTGPICAYGIHKLAIEKYLQLFRSSRRLDSVCLRIANHYGEEQDLNKPLGAMAHFASRAVHGLPIEIWGDGNVIRDYIHVDDVAEAFLRAARYQGQERVMNVGTGRGTSLNQLVQLLRASLSTLVEVKYQAARSFDVPSNILDVQRVRRELGWEPRMSVESGIARMIAKAQHDERRRPAETLAL
jgi:UDP-glucose 4-epimerase